MEEEISRALNRRRADNIPNAPKTNPISISTMKIFGINDAKRMSFDENMPQYGASPLSPILSQSPGTAWNWSSVTANRGRRDSLKNMWHLQDFGTN